MYIYPYIYIGDGTVTTDESGNTVRQNHVYIAIKDENGNPANGNGVSVTYRVTTTTSAGSAYYLTTVNVVGQMLHIAKATLSIINEGTTYDDFGNAIVGDFQVISTTVYSIESWDAIAPDTPTVSDTICDAAISAVSILKQESAFGAGDGQVTIIASSTQLPITYSLDGNTFQASPTFTGLVGGSYTAYISDANGCTATKAFQVPTTANLLVSDPSETINGHVSRWNAAFNPIYFTYQRKDFEVTAITNVSGFAKLAVNADLSGLLVGDAVYVNAGAYNGIYVVNQISAGFIQISAAYNGPGAGFVNINSLRLYYAVLTRITFVSQLTGQFEQVISTNRPNASGLVKADLYNFLQTLLAAKDDSNYTAINYRDTNLSASYTVEYAETWYGHTPEYISISNPYYVTFAARQLGQPHGGNMAEYVPFKTLAAKWVTDFEEPAYSNGYPFDLSFIYGEDLAGLNLYYKITLLDINRQQLATQALVSYLLNENTSFLLNQDGSKLIIASQALVNTPIAEHVGLNRLLINANLPDSAWYFIAAIYYDDANGNPVQVLADQTVRIDKAIDVRSVWIRWIGLTGSWNYYRFVWNQAITLDVKDGAIVEKYVLDWANQDTIQDVVKKNAGRKMQVFAEDLAVSDIQGLQSIKFSPKVQLLMSANPIRWQTVIVASTTFAEYETLNKQAPFTITLNLPSINTQFQ
jgi:hypothetical protein